MTTVVSAGAWCFNAVAGEGGSHGVPRDPGSIPTVMVFVSDPAASALVESFAVVGRACIARCVGTTQSSLRPRASEVIE